MSGVVGVSGVDVVDLRRGDDDCAAAIDRACRQDGFFVVVGHGVSAALADRLDAAAREFFALPDDEKAAIAMRHGGAAWRGWFPVGGELTSGRPDRKEGIYFGQELPAADERPMHGPNLFPERPAGLKDLVLDYLDAVTAVGQRVVALMDRALGVDGRLAGLVDEPLVLFRIFGYPPLAVPAAPDDGGSGDEFSVGEHTDYGLLTLLRQDDAGGLEVRGPDGWRSVAPVADSFVCNIGDMLEKATGGRYRSTPHRVRNRSGRYRVSMPLFLDPGWDARVQPLVRAGGPTVAGERWDGADPHLFDGRYGDYVWDKVGKVFPDLR